MTEQTVLIQKRGRVKGTITRIRTFAEQQLTSNTSVEEITVRLDKLEGAWTEFCEIEDTLCTIEGQTSEMAEFENKYFETTAMLTSALNSKRPAISEETNDLKATLSNVLQQQQFFIKGFQHENNNFNSKLPRLNIPSFSGDYKEWASFQDLFEATVHKSTTLSSAQKFQYLKGLLKGNAANLVRHLAITEANYNEAWEKLKTRFDKKPQIVTSFIRTYLEQPQLHQANTKSLRQLCDVSDEVIRGLKALGAEAERRDPWLIHIALTKLDADTRDLWVKEVSETNLPTFDAFLNFLTRRCDGLETCGAISKRSTPQLRTLYSTSTNASHTSCPKCKEDHLLYQCAQFKADAVNIRKDFVMTNSLCFKCLSPRHSVRACYSKVRCKYCKGHHHPLLHDSSRLSLSTPTTQGTEINVKGNQSFINPEQAQNQVHKQSGDYYQTPKTAESCQPLAELSSLNSLVQEETSCSLLPTAVVNILDSQGNLHACRLLLDSGSQVSLISEACAQRLHLKRDNARLIINGLSAKEAGVTKGRVHLNICSRLNPMLKVHTVAFVMNKLTSLVPSEKYTVGRYNLSGLPLADPNFFEPSEIDVILGSDQVFEVLRSGQKRDENDHIIAHETIFGWIIPGHLSANTKTAVTCFSNASTDIDKALTRFWELEEVVTNTKGFTNEEHQCEKHFQANFSRNRAGRCIVSLPFKPESPALGESLRNALIRLRAMERRFAKDSSFKEQYMKFMFEYEKLGHMEEIPLEEIEIENAKTFYLPHHAVFKNTPIPKIRVVFDGSCSSSSGSSLNSKLMVGPTIQRDLTSILINFRKFKIAFSADIEKMYRQVLITVADRDFQRIVWRDEATKPVKHYRLTTVTYGTAAAPFLATRVLKKIGEDNKALFSATSAIIENDFYVDDLLSGADCLRVALQLKAELKDLLYKNGFNLTKWRSNSTQLLNSNRSNIDKDNCVPIDDGSSIAKVLGIQWDSVNDVFLFQVSAFSNGNCSKRTILSDASRIFDPLGWLTPLIIVVKVMLQHLWLAKLDWDETMPTDILNKWNHFKDEIVAVENLRIPRQIAVNQNSIQIHGFSDASENAYAAVLYCRSVDNEGRVTVRIIASKSKVAPLKQISIPRLELCGALLLARLTIKVLQALSLTNAKIYAWTDSSIVLAWLSKAPRSLKTFVANRTSEIMNLLPTTAWRHVSSIDNPADVASRGISPKELVNLNIWWQGPLWLSEDPVNWPDTSFRASMREVKKEEKKQIVLSYVNEVNDELLTSIANRTSSFSRLIRILAYCRRFYENCKSSKENRMINALSASDIISTTVTCLKLVQQSAFSKDSSSLKLKGTCSSKGSLTSLHPFIDENDILRVGGRIENSGLNFNAKHPIILPKDHPITSMLVYEMHRMHLHPGMTLLLSLIRQRYWIIGARSLVKKVCHECITCCRYRAAKTSQLMGELPTERVTVSRPFSKVGIDYAGPVMLVSRIGRGARPFKGYISLFVCFATKAIHLELVSSLSADSFVAALRRFSARRGIPTHIFCDNGTNFVGGKRQLKELHKIAMTNANNSSTNHFLLQNQIIWKFIPPGAPHFGGLWEAGVKSVKWHLRRVIGETLLSFEEMNTMLCQVEALLNSRPYGALSNDPDDLEPLTPGHLLIGEPPTTLPDADFRHVKITRLGRWQHLQSMMQSFWRRWRSEYITALQERSKWKTPKANLEPGNLVLIKDDNLPPAKWLMGRILMCHPGLDNLVRVVTIKTQKGTLDRSVNKVVKLPIC